MEEQPLRDDSTESGELEDEGAGNVEQPQPARDESTESGALEDSD